MKFYNVISGLVFVVFSCIAINANATLVKTPVTCAWSTVSVQSSFNGAIVTEKCDAIATRVRNYSNGGSNCNINTSYSYDGSCDSPSFYAWVDVPSSTASCGPNAGKLYGASVYVGQNASFPQSSIDAFCGACGYDVTVVSSGPMGAQLSVSCKK